MNQEISYWVFQGDPARYDLEEALRKNLLADWTVTAHKDLIKPGDRVILWLTGPRAGCYALAEVNGYPAKRATAQDQHLWKTDSPEPDSLSVPIKILRNLVETPFYQDQRQKYPGLVNLKVGMRGTNFMASKEEFEILSGWADGSGTARFWLYQPGANGSEWETFYQESIMAISWDELGDLASFADKASMVKKLQELEETTSSKKNDATACWSFVHLIKTGDVILVKKGKNELAGWGIVKGEYFHSPQRKTYHNCRKVEWKAKGVWLNPDAMVTKTLTDITYYKGYPEKLLTLMTGKRTRLIKDPTVASRESSNKILFGPPGTGKTFHTVNHALAILLGKKLTDLDQDREVLHAQFDQFRAEGRIGFVTFHQSFSYEDFIEGIKPLTDEDTQTLQYLIQPGIFKTMAVNAAAEFLKLPVNRSRAKTFDEYWNAYILVQLAELENGKRPVLQSKSGKSLSIERITEHDNLILRHQNASTDQTYTVSKERTRKLAEVFPDLDVLEVASINKAFRNVIGGSNVSAYWAVLSSLQGFIKSNPDPEPGYEPALVSWQEKARAVAEIDWADIDPDSSGVLPYVLIIDEINRGNIPAIFGELITLIEDDKRGGRGESTSLQLPYSRDLFTVPPNLYLIGTMNTADRSVEALDAALRRRFSFIPQMPNPEVLPDNVDGINLRAMLACINERLERLLDRDHSIGHAFLMKSQNLEDLRTCFANKIIPQLQEYFYGDWRKIGMILGDAFVQKQFFQDKLVWPRGYDDQDNEAHEVLYRITEQSSWDQSAFKSIYE